MITKLGQEAIDYKSRLATILRNDYLKNYENKKVNPNKEGIIGYSQYRFSPDHNPLYARHYVDRTDFVDALPFGKKASIGNIYDPYGIENADLIEKEYLEKLIQNNMARKAARNAGRGVAGYFGGAIPGSMLGTVPRLLRRSVPLAAMGGMFGGIAGGLTGAHMATNKYSKGRAKEIMAQE